MLAHAFMPIKFWDHSFTSTVHLINRLPTTSLSNFPVCSFVDTCMLDLFSTATCSADFVLGVRLCFWVRHFGFYSLGSLLPLSLLMQFKMRLLCMSLFHSFFPFLLSFSIICHHFPP